jgi:hypothetical protein
MTGAKMQSLPGAKKPQKSLVDTGAFGYTDN